MEKYKFCEKKSNIDSLLLVIYVFAVILSSPIEMFLGVSNVSSIMAVITVVISFIKNKSINIKMFIMMLFILILLSLDFIFFDFKDSTIKTFILLARWGIIPLYLSSNISDYKELLINWSKISILNLIIINLFYIIGFYNKLGTYMTVGVNLTYSFIPFIIKYYLDKDKISLVLLTITFIEIIIFGNRGSIIVCFIITLYLEFSNIIENRNIIKFNFNMIAGFIFILNLENILNILGNLLKYLGISSYSFDKLIQVKNVGFIAASSTRDSIYRIATDLILDTGFRANGTGFFDYVTGLGYPHNIILEIAVSFGIVGILLFIFSILLLIIKYYKDNRQCIYYKKIVVSMFIFCVIRLSISSTLWSEPFLWITIGFVLFNNKYKQKNI